MSKRIREKRPARLSGKDLILIWFSGTTGAAISKLIDSISSTYGKTPAPDYVPQALAGYYNLFGTGFAFVLFSELIIGGLAWVLQTLRVLKP
jgi:hypothetical protein